MSQLIKHDQEIRKINQSYLYKEITFISAGYMMIVSGGKNVSHGCNYDYSFLISYS